MSLLFIDSFDHYATADITKKWSTQQTAGGGTLATTTIASAAARYGASGLRSTGGSASWTCPAPQLTIASGTPASGVVGLAVRLTTGAWNLLNAGNAIAVVLDAGSEQLSFLINSDGTITAKRGTSAGANTLGTTSSALPSSGWTYVEIKWTIHDSTGTVDIQFNGASVLALTGQDTKNTANATWQTIRIADFRGSAGTAGAFVADVDDVYVCDLSGSVNNTFLGDVRVDAHLPNAAGTTSGWTRSTGTDQWATVDDTSLNEDTDYNTTSVAATTDTLNFPSLTPTGATIAGVQMCLVAKKTTAGAALLASVVRHLTTDYPATAQACSTTYAVQRYVYETNPGTSAAWVEADFNAAEFGYKKTA